MVRYLAAQVLAAALIIGVAALFLVLTPIRLQAAECGLASWYGNEHHGRRTASGEVFNQWAMTAASNSLPLGSMARVTAGKRTVVVRVTDTGGFGKYGRIIDLSRGAFAKLAPTEQGIARVCVSRL